MNFWKSLLKGRGTPRPKSKAPVVGDRPAGRRQVTRQRSQILVGTAQSTGIERSHNEDALLALSAKSAGEQAIPDFGLFIVADGMGGHRLGEVASAASVKTVARYITEHTVLRPFGPFSSKDALPLHDVVRGAFEQANAVVAEVAPGGGTTLTLVLLTGDQLTVGHVGDSRAYVITKEKCQVITRDHSYTERLRELGRLSPEEAASHPQRNVLYRAIGQGVNFQVDVFSLPSPRDGHILVCSDGLWGVVSERRIHEIVRKSKPPRKACEALVEAANQAGGPDNISAILVYCPPD